MQVNMSARESRASSVSWLSVLIYNVFSFSRRRPVWNGHLKKVGHNIFVLFFGIQKKKILVEMTSLVLSWAVLSTFRFVLKTRWHFFVMLNMCSNVVLLETNTNGCINMFLYFYGRLTLYGVWHIWRVDQSLVKIKPLIYVMTHAFKMFDVIQRNCWINEFISFKTC